MDLALYHPQHGYYTTRAQRSGRDGDFYTSVDAGPLFGEILAAAIARFAGEIEAISELDLVEAGAGNGRLMRDLLDALARDFPPEYARVRVHLVERSEPACAMHPEVLGPHARRLATSGPALPATIDGIVFANEMLDALPVHVLVRRGDGLREIFVDAAGDRVVEREGPLSSPALRDPIDASGIDIPLDGRAEVSPAATAWIRDVGARLRRGAVIVIDYGDEARELRSADRPDGTLRAFRAHRVSENWLDEPGAQDLTAHVDFTALDRAAQDAGLELVERREQAKFLIAHGALEKTERRAASLPAKEAVRWRLAAKTLLVPGSIGWTHKVAVYRKIVDDR
jgi:SAM-dependent MidA family methyltransferase